MGTVIGIVVGDCLYSWFGYYTWAFAAAGLLLIPVLPWLYFMMPESVPEHQRKPISVAVVRHAVVSQSQSFTMFGEKRRLWSVATVNFLVQFVSAGLYACLLYWGEWKCTYVRNSQAGHMAFGIRLVFLR